MDCCGPGALTDWIYQTDFSTVDAEGIIDTTSPALQDAVPDERVAVLTRTSSIAAASTDEEDNDIMEIPTTKQPSKVDLIMLLKDCAEHLEMTDFSPILYQTLGALHEYTGRHAGLPPPAKSATGPRPSFQKSGGVNDVLASGWMEEMSSSSRSSGGSSSSSKQIVWKSVLALLVQKDQEEPCLWITREVLAAEEGGGEPELETLHRIPMRRLQTVEYVDFYGDHRLALRIKRREHDLIFRCNDDGSSALAWVQQLEVAKGKGRGSSSGGSKSNKAAAVDQSFELEMDEATGEVVNLNEEDNVDAIKDDQQPTEEDQRMADRLQEAEDLRRLRNDIEKAEEKEQQKRNAEEAERKKQEAAEKAERFKQEQAKAATRKKLAEAAEEQRLKEQHEKAARAALEQAVKEQQARQKEQEVQSLKQQEDEKRQREYALEQQKKAAAEKRRQDLELQRRAAQELQKKKDLEEKRKFLATEQRKLDLIAKAKAGKGEQQQSPSNASLMDKLNNQISALDAADRLRAEEAKKKAEGKEQEVQAPEDPDTARKRIAEEARQRLVQEEAEKLRKQNEDRGQQQQAAAEAEATRQQQAQTWAEQQRRQAAPQQQQSYGAPQQYPQPAPGQPQQQAWQAAQLQQQQQQAWNLWHQQQQQTQGRALPQQQQQQQYQRPASTGQIPGYYAQQRAPQQAPAPQAFAPGQQHSQQTQQPFPQAATAPGYPGRPQQPAPSHHPPTGVDMKYTQMAQQAQQEEQSSSTTDLKRNILLHWALQPPANQILRTIDQLLCNIHTVYPPAFGVAGHVYFKGWQAVSRADICNPSGAIDDDRLKKAVKKLRFFLHPDKLPRDLTEEQLFMCKLLWDVSNDSFEDYKKSAEELDWVG